VHKQIRRIILSVLALLCLFSVLPAVPLTAEEKNVTLTGGMYRIKNASNGLYLSAYTYSSKNKNTLRIATAPGNVKDDGQFFVLTDAGNDCWTLSPKNDKGSYFVCCEKGTEAGATVNKKKDSDESCLFDIVQVDGFFTIAPSYGDNIKAVISVGNQKSGKNYFCEVSDYSRGDRTQQWILEPTSTTGITLSFNKTKIKKFTCGTFYAALAPSGLPANASWTSSDDSVLLVGENGDFCALGTGTTVVEATCEGFSATINVTVVNNDCFTWYSQNAVTGSYWDASLLTTQYWSSGGYRMRYMWDGKTSPGYSNWMDTGCAICSIASILHNMNAKMTVGYDFRSAQDGNLPADPYTVSLANSGKTQVTNNTDVVYGNPSYVAWKYISDRFFVDGEAMSYRKVYGYPSRKKIKTLLEAHPQGIIAELSKGSDTHYVVISECVNPNETVSSKIEFRIYDPAAYYPEDGDNVLFSQSTSYKQMYYRYGNISSIIIYDVESNVNK